jgi:cytochrome c peroxidase
MAIEELQMRNTSYAVWAAVLLLGAGCARQEVAVDPARLSMFAPLPDVVPVKAIGPLEERIALGRMLYYDPRLSKSQKIACNDCHDLARYGVDGEPTSQGHNGQRGDRNSPTVYNAAAQFVQFWDGRAPNVEEQAKGPVLNPVEMAMASDKQVVAVLKSIPGYVAAFRRAYPDARDPLTYDNMADAIGAFERQLLTPSRWDKYLTGDDAALAPEEQQGFNAFVSAGCQTCHAGALMGGHLFQRIGLVRPYPDTSDPGRYKVTGSESDRMVFKVPSLRNIDKTAPYFHHGRVATLDQAVVEMGDYQLGKPLTEAQVRSIVTFLKTLTGDIPADYIRKPDLPPSGPKTPGPETAD